MHCRHFKVAFELDPRISFPTSIYSALDRLMNQLASNHVWREGALHEALAFETHASEHMTSDLTSAIAITMPLTSFFRTVLTTTLQWVRDVRVFTIKQIQPYLGDHASPQVLLLFFPGYRQLGTLCAGGRRWKQDPAGRQGAGGRDTPSCTPLHHHRSV
jgi:hypothetical protein